MWNNGPTILEGEDELALRDEFAKLVAKYPNQDPFEIGEYVFRNLKDPGLRGQQAAMFWLKDVEVKELISKYRTGQAGGEAIPTKDQAAMLAWSLANDPAADKKDRIAALNLFGQLNGMIVKSVEKKVDDSSRRRPPTILVARYAD
jgi:hypothetical protein